MRQETDCWTDPAREDSWAWRMKDVEPAETHETPTTAKQWSAVAVSTHWHCPPKGISLRAWTADEPGKILHAMQILKETGWKSCNNWSFRRWARPSNNHILSIQVNPTYMSRQTNILKLVQSYHLGQNQRKKKGKTQISSPSSSQAGIANHQCKLVLEPTCLQTTKHNTNTVQWARLATTCNTSHMSLQSKQIENGCRSYLRFPYTSVR